MSIRPCVEVCCDGPTPQVECPDSAAWTDYGTATALRRRMKADGWRSAHGVDRCPACVAEPGPTKDGTDER